MPQYAGAKTENEREREKRKGKMKDKQRKKIRPLFALKEGERDIKD